VTKNKLTREVAKNLCLMASIDQLYKKANILTAEQVGARELVKWEIHPD
jgi:hypothetical protein